MSGSPAARSTLRSTGGCATSSALTIPAPRLAPQRARDGRRAATGTPAKTRRTLGARQSPRPKSCFRPVRGNVGRAAFGKGERVHDPVEQFLADPIGQGRLLERQVVA